MCVTESQIGKACPITDVKIVKRQDYNAESYTNYSIAEAPTGLSWLLLFSRDSSNMPLSRLELTEERPCTLENTFKSSNNIVDENYDRRTRDPFASLCHV